MLSTSEADPSSQPVSPLISKFPDTPIELFNTLFTNRQSYEEMAQQVFCSTKVSKEGAEMIEKHTRLQRECMEWHNQRRGRLTASVFHDVFRHKQGNAVLLVSRLLKPNDLTTLPAINWGIANESKARGIYTQKMASTHTNSGCRTSGLVMNPSYPFLGASPDGVTLCGCCGEGIIGSFVRNFHIGFDPDYECH